MYPVSTIFSRIKAHSWNGTDEIAKATVGDRTTPYDEDLGNCEVCSCTNRAKVWYGGKFKPSDKEIEKFKEVNCWQLGQLTVNKGITW